MSYKDFKNAVNGFIRKSGQDIAVFFINSGGKYIASCAGGITISGNRINKSLTVRWGSGHQAMAKI